NWATSLGGATLFDGTNTYEGTITSSEITFDMSSNPSEVPSGSLLNYVLAVYTTGIVTDGDALQFEIGTDHGFTADVAGSVFNSTLPGALTSTQHSIDVVATFLSPEAPSTVPLSENFEVAVGALDDNGNIDTAPRTISISKTSGSGTLTGTGLTSQTMTDGLFEWSDLQLDAADDYVLTVDDDGSALTGSVMLEAVDGVAGPAQLLITEIMVTPTESEFIEIYNNTDGTVFLDDYYLTDAVSSSILYYEIVNGAGIGTDNFDFHVRFPAGSSIEPGETQTIALAGSDNFLAAFGSNPTYELQEDGAEPDAIPDMINAGNIGGSVGLSNGGEMVVLYYWDGESDLVTDIDYVVWGDKNEAFDKSGISIDGPDDGTETSTYFTETAIASQDVIATGSHAFGNSWQREDFNEGTEVKTGGNGVDGHDETSENFSATFIERTPTPGLQVFEAPTIVIDDELFDANLGNVLIGGSTTSTYTVSGVNLTGDITITSAGAYAISTDGSTFGSEVTLSPNEGIVSETTITVQFTPDVEGSIEGEIAHDTDGSGTTTIEVSGAGITETTIFFEGFGNCDALNSFTSQSVIGDEVWECEFFGETGYGVRMSGFNGG
ncbi:MAG: lamin tail domain-containing protein, partial [Cyclobacteriaceae bacterium]